MKKTSKFISIILAILMLLSAVPMMSFAAEKVTGSCGPDASWVLDLDTGAMVVSGEGEVYFGRDFEYKLDTKNVVIEEGITSIGENAFDSFAYLESVVFEGNEISIEKFAFRWDVSLESVSFEEGSTIEISNTAFAMCLLLEDFIIPADSTYSIADLAFAGCISLQNVYFGKDSEGYISDYAFKSIINIDNEEAVNAFHELFLKRVIGTMTEEEDEYFDSVVYEYEPERSPVLEIVLLGDDSVAAYAEANGFEFISLEELGDMAAFACEVTPINHVPAEPVIENEVPATCKSEGSYDKVVYCSICETELSRVKFTTAKAEHTLPLAMLADDDSKAPTCTENGKTASVACVICGTVIIPSETIPASGHRYEAVASTAATCSRKGTTTYQCVYCGDDYVKADKAKLAHVDGDSDGKCDVCSEVIGAVSTGKRCSFCDKYEQNKNTPVIGFFFGILHSIIHGISAK